MSKAYANVNSSTGTFAGWLSKSNELFYDMSTIIVTVADVAAPNNSNASRTTGNADIQGYFSANNMIVWDTLSGGQNEEWANTNTLYIVSNTQIGNSTVADTLEVYGDTTFYANVTIGSDTADDLTIESNTNINGEVFFHANAQFDDSDYLKFGTGGDVSVQWNGSDLFTRFETSNANFIIEDSSGNDVIDIDVDSSTLTIARFDNEIGGPSIVLLDDGTTLDGNTAGGIFFKGQDEDSAVVEYASIKSIAEDVSNTSIDGSLTLYATIANTSTAMIAVNEASDAAVSLRYDGSEKLATKTDGVDVTGELQSDSLDVDGVWDITGVGSLHANTQWDDNARLLIGTSVDLQVYHDATDSHLVNSTGELYIQGDGITIRSNTGTEEYITADVNGAVTLYHNDIARLATTATGVSVTGVMASTTATTSGLATLESLDVTNDAVINGDLTIQGDFLATGSTNMTVNTATFTTMTTIGDSVLGDSASDTLTISATVSANSDIVPAIDSTYDLGSNASRFALAYIDDATVTSNVNIQNAGHVKFYDTDSSNFVAFKSAGTVASNVIWTLPNIDAPISGYSLQSNGSGVLSWGPAGATTTSDESTNAEEYLYFSDITSGAVTDVHHDTGLRYNPSLGRITTASANVVTLSLNGTAVTSTATELNLLDGVTSTTAELNIVDGGTSASSITSAGTDRVVYNDGGVMKQVALTTLDTYFSGTTKTLTNKTLTSPSIGTSFTFDSVTVSAIQTSAESFVDNNTSLMTSAAIADKAQAVVDADTTILRSNAADTKTSGDLTFNDNIAANFGSGTDVEMYYDGSDMFMDINDGGLYLRDGTNSNATAFAFTPTSASLLLANYDAAGSGPEIILRHDSASPAASDEIGQIFFQGDDSGGTNTDYAYIDARIVDPTNTSEDGSLLIYVKQAGTDRIHFSANSGVTTLYHNGNAKIATTSTGISVTGNITVSGTVDGRDIASDGSKLDGIEANAKNDQTITAGSGLSGGGTGDVTLSHADTSSQSSVNNSGATVIQDVTLDTYGHVTALGSHTLTLANLGYTGATNANYITNNNQLTNGAGYVTTAGARSALSSSAGTGAYNSSTGVITIPTHTSHLTNNSGYVTSSGVTSVATSNGLTGGTITSTGTLSMSGSYTGTFTVTGAIRSTSDITAYYSDERLKQDITPIANALDKIVQISGVTYRSNDVAKEHGYTNDKLQYGVIAQEIEAIMPEIVVPAPFDIAKNEETGEEYSKTGENYKTVQYEKIIPLLIESIKQLKQELDELKGNK